MRDHNRARGSACALRGRQPWQGRQRFVRVGSKAGSARACRMACRRALMYHRGRTVAEAELKALLPPLELASFAS